MGHPNVSGRKIGIVLLFLATSLQAKSHHPVSVSWAEVVIAEDHLSIQFKILAEDLVLFNHPPKVGNNEYSGLDLSALVDQHGTHLLVSFQVTDEKDQPLIGTIRRSTAPTLTSARIAKNDLMKHEILYDIHMPFNGKGWQELTFTIIPHHHIPSVTFLSAYTNEEQLAKTVEVSPGNPFTLRSDGQSTKINPSLLTSSYFSMSTSGIHHELTLPWSVLQSFLSVSAADSTHRSSIEGYFSKSNSVRTGTHQLSPTLSHLKFFDQQDPKEGLVYLNLLYPTADYPDSLYIHWEDYSWRFRWFESEFQANDSIHHHTFSKYQPLWQLNAPPFQKER